MGKIISAFEANSKYGGGLVTRKIFELFQDTHSLHAVRRNVEGRLIRGLRTLVIWLRVPTLHPIFCTYSAEPCGDGTLLNFSQTFSLAIRFPQVKFYFVAHDVVVQKRIFLNGWVRASEARLFRQADRIYVLSEKDRRLIRRFYEIDDLKIVNLFDALFPEIIPFHKVIIKKGRFRVLFIGSLGRKENYLGFKWFYENVFVGCRESVDVACVGELDSKSVKEFKGIKFLGFVDNLNSELSRFDFTIAPIFDGAGIKIKVVDSLVENIPVIGTPKAFEGLGRPSRPYCTTDPMEWQRVLNGDRIEYFYRPQVQRS